MRKKDAFVAKILNTRLTKGFMAMFAPAESLPSPATLIYSNVLAQGSLHGYWCSVAKLVNFFLPIFRIWTPYDIKHMYKDADRHHHLGAMFKYQAGLQCHYSQTDSSICLCGAKMHLHNSM